MHLDPERVERHLHGELAPSDAAAVRAHLMACAPCSRDVARAGREEAWIFEQLAGLDHAPPSVSIETMVPAVGGWRRGWGRMAAAIALTLAAAGVVYAAPGSPLPGAIRHAVDWLGLQRPTAPPAARAPVDAASPAGIAVVPGASLIVAFDVGRVPDTAIVRLTDGADVEVRSLGGGATFTSGPGLLSIEHHGAPVRFDVLIPRLALAVEIRSAGRRLLLKRRYSVVAPSDSDSAGRYVLPLSPSRR